MPFFFHFEITIESEEVKAKMIQRSHAPFTQFPPAVTSLLLIVQFQDREPDIGTMYACGSVAL